MQRRELIKNLTVLPLAGGIIGAGIPLGDAKAAPPPPQRFVQGTGRSHFYQCSRHPHFHDGFPDARLCGGNDPANFEGLLPAG